MPVDRSYISMFAGDPDTLNLFQALTSLANFSDGLESAAGIVVGQTGSSTQTPAPSNPTWTITAADGIYSISITPPSTSSSTTGSSNAPLIQYQIQSGLDLNFNANSSVNTYTLGYGQTTIAIVNPNENRYFQIQGRYQGSAWSAWLTYSNAAGVVALNAGDLTTT